MTSHHTIITASQYHHSTTAPQHHSTTAPQHHSTIAFGLVFSIPQLFEFGTYLLTFQGII
jgi:hypothetical protein